MKVDALLAHRGANEDFRIEWGVEAGEEALAGVGLRGAVDAGHHLLGGDLGGVVDRVPGRVRIGEVAARGAHVLEKDDEAIEDALFLPG